MPTTTYTAISPRTNAYAATKMLEFAQPEIVLGKFGVTKPMPKNKTTGVIFRRPVPFTAKTTPLTEGVTPDTTQFGYEDVNGTLAQYGDLIEITDVIEDTHEDPVLNDASEQCGENIGRTKEALDYAVLRAGTAVHYANGVTRSAVNSKISLNQIRRVTRTLRAQKAKKITKVQDGSVKIGTAPVEAAYIAVAHSDLEADIRDLPGFRPVSEYGTRKLVHPMECGTVENVRFVLSSDLEPFVNAGGSAGGAVLSSGGSNADVYPVLFFGQHAYGHVPLKGYESVSPTIIPVNQKDKSDPLGQRGYVGWKCWHLCMILNQLWIQRLEVAVSSLD